MATLGPEVSVMAHGRLDQEAKGPLQKIAKRTNVKQSTPPAPASELTALLRKPWGKVFAPFMYVLESNQGATSEEDAWTPEFGGMQNFGPLSISPAAGVLNYGQGLFEGMKAYRTQDGRIVTFRAEMNARRAQEGARRLCMPPVPESVFVNAVKQAVAHNAHYVPAHGEGSLYLRPMLIGTGPQLGLFAAPQYTFLVYASPVGSYFKGSQADPIDLLVENSYHRACPGGSGGVKAIGNYAPTLLPQREAKKTGFDNCLYLDSVENKYLEEVGTCNVFVVKDKVLKTPALRGTILAGVTRDSIMQIARGHGYEVVEKKVSIDELVEADEAFVTGTAVGVCPIGSIFYKEQKHVFKGSPGPISQLVSVELSETQNGQREDTRGWVITIDGYA